MIADVIKRIKMRGNRRLIGSCGFSVSNLLVIEVRSPIHHTDQIIIQIAAILLMLDIVTRQTALSAYRHTYSSDIPTLGWAWIDSPSDLLLGKPRFQRIGKGDGGVFFRFYIRC